MNSRARVGIKILTSRYHIFHSFMLGNATPLFFLPHAKSLPFKCMKLVLLLRCRWHRLDLLFAVEIAMSLFGGDSGFSLFCFFSQRFLFST